MYDGYKMQIFNHAGVLAGPSEKTDDGDVKHPPTQTHAHTHTELKAELYYRSTVEVFAFEEL